MGLGEPGGRARANSVVVGRPRDAGRTGRVKVKTDPQIRRSIVLKISRAPRAAVFQGSAGTDPGEVRAGGRAAALERPAPVRRSQRSGGQRAGDRWAVLENCSRRASPAGVARIGARAAAMRSCLQSVGRVDGSTWAGDRAAMIDREGDERRQMESRSAERRGGVRRAARSSPPSSRQGRDVEEWGRCQRALGPSACAGGLPRNGTKRIEVPPPPPGTTANGGRNVSSAARTESRRGSRASSTQTVRPSCPAKKSKVNGAASTSRARGIRVANPFAWEA